MLGLHSISPEPSGDSYVRVFRISAKSLPRHEPGDHYTDSWEDEVNLINRIKNGDRSALHTLVTDQSDYIKMLSRLYEKKYHSLLPADDIRQRTYLKLLEMKFDGINLKPGVRFRDIVSVILNNIVIDAYREKKTKPEVSFDDLFSGGYQSYREYNPDNFFECDRQDPSKILEQKEFLSIADDVIQNELTVPQRTAFLGIFNCESVGEMIKNSGFTDPTFHKHKGRALNKIVAALRYASERHPMLPAHQPVL